MRQPNRTWASMPTRATCIAIEGDASLADAASTAAPDRAHVFQPLVLQAFLAYHDGHSSILSEDRWGHSGVLSPFLQVATDVARAGTRQDVALDALTHKQGSFLLLVVRVLTPFGNARSRLLRGGRGRVNRATAPQRQDVHLSAHDGPHAILYHGAHVIILVTSASADPIGPVT